MHPSAELAQAASERRAQLHSERMPTFTSRLGAGRNLRWRSGFPLAILQLFIAFIAISQIHAQFSFTSDQWNIDDGLGQCQGADCQKYACTGQPGTPFCRGCSGNPNVYNVDPEDCLETDPNMKCSTCLDMCETYRTGWEDVELYPATPETYTCRRSGKPCRGPCEPSWYLNCREDNVNECQDYAGDSCEPGAYVCTGQEKDSMPACDIESCDPAYVATYDRSRCSCTSGQCMWIDGPSVSRRMEGPNELQRCSGRSFGDTGQVEPFHICDSSSCTSIRSYGACPSCRTSDRDACIRVCQLDVQCIAVTWDPPITVANASRSGRCYKVLDTCELVDSSTGEEVWTKEIGWSFPRECLPRLQATEDRYSALRLTFEHARSRPLARGDLGAHWQPLCTECTQVEAIVNVKYGSLDLGIPDQALVCIDPGYDPSRDGNPFRDCARELEAAQADFRFFCPTWPGSIDGCDPRPLNQIDLKFGGAKVTFLPSCSPTDCGSQVTFPGLKIVGTYPEVREALHNLTYLSGEDQNSARIRSRIYSASTSRSEHWPITKPFEELTLSVRFGPPQEADPVCDSCGRLDARKEPHVQRYLLHILQINDRPVLSNPVNSYTRPFYCDATPEEEDCFFNGQSLGREQCHECHFGPFWAYEGLDELRAVTGLRLIDEDILEGCSWADQACSSVDSQVLTLNGAFELNTLAGLNIYRSEDASKGFTGALSAAVTAMTVLNYRAALPKTISVYNTQHSGNTEVVQVITSDQGFSGAGVQAGGSELVFGVSLDATTTIPVTIVAINNAPEISFDLEGSTFTVQEDVQTALLGISVNDVDVDDVVHSTLAQALWMGSSQYQDILNKLMATVEVSFGRLFLPVVTNLVITSTFDELYITINGRYRVHDLCRLKPRIDEPAEGNFFVRNCILSNLGTTDCATGKEPACTCKIEDSCSDLSRILLFVDRTNPSHQQYLANLQYSIDTSPDRSCGGVPWYPAPSSLTLGKTCRNDRDCSELGGLLPCSEDPLGCLCCANLNVTCSQHSDCDAVEPGSLCGCSWDGPASTRGELPARCGPWLGPQTAVDGDLNKDGKVDNAELATLIPLCASEDVFCEIYEQTVKPLDCPDCVGQPCTYRGADSDQCLPPAILSNGTISPTVTDLLGVDGSARIQMYGRQSDVNKALAAMEYVTNSNYNSLYRNPLCYPPPRQSTQACVLADPNFDPSDDHRDTLTIVMDDMGNSGGTDRTVLVSSAGREIVSIPVNDRPRVRNPFTIETVEDVPFSMINWDLIGQGGMARPQPAFYEAFLAGECRWRTDADAREFDPQFGSACACYRTCPDPTVQLADIGCDCNSVDCDLRCAAQVDADMRLAAAEGLPARYGGIGQGVYIEDPDNLDYEFASKPIEVNVSCQHGRLLLNEAFLQQKEIIDTRIVVLDYPGFGVRGAAAEGLYHIPLAQSQCAECRQGWEWIEGASVCCDVSPCRRCERWGVGNRFISIAGTLADVNLALSNLTYVNDLNFNTRYGLREEIIIEVSDEGALGDNYETTPAERALSLIEVQVESVNDPPTIQRLQPVQRDTGVAEDGETVILLYQLEPREINQTQDYLVVDEDNFLVINHTALWIDDADATEAELITQLFDSVDRSNLERQFNCLPGDDIDGLLATGYPAQCRLTPARDRTICYGGFKDGCECLDDSGCTGGCTCAAACCSCDRPPVCPPVIGGTPVIPAGELTVELRTEQGLLSFYPPPGRDFLSLSFHTNSTPTALADGGGSAPCPACMQNQTSIILKGSLPAIQAGLRQKFLQYIGRENFYGRDSLFVWVSDQGYTDRSYEDSRQVRIEIPIVVRPVNDQPQMRVPTDVINYAKGQRCRSDPILEFRDQQGLICSQPALSALPPVYDEAARAESRLFFEDDDIDDQGYGNLTVTFQLQGNQAGSFFFNQTIPTVIYFQTTDEDGQTSLSLWGKINEINELMKYIFFDANPTFTGYAPMDVFLNDNGNYGEAHCVVSDTEQCRDLTFTCETTTCPRSDVLAVPDICIPSTGRDCITWISRFDRPHRLFENRVRTRREVVDVSIGATRACDVEGVEAERRCEVCARLPGCNWCPGHCGGRGKCMIGKGSPTFETCNDGSYGRCEATSVDTVGIAIAAAAVGVVLLASCFMLHKWLRRRHGSVGRYVAKKQSDVRKLGQHLNIMPPANAKWLESALCLVVGGVLLLVISGIFSPGNPEFNYSRELYLDQVASITLDVDHCNIRFLPARNFPAPDNNLSAVKVQLALVEHAEVMLDAQTCQEDVVIAINNNREESIKYKDYYCNLRVLVPDGLVLPRITIAEHGQGVITTVRAGPMDDDTPDFGLNFGPNTFTLQGGFIGARLENVSAKVFEYESTRGNLLAKDLSTAQSASFKTVEANMQVSTRKMTTVRVLRAAGNDVCLTAANNSLYVDDNCETVCEYVPSTVPVGAYSDAPEFGPLELCPDGATLKRDVTFVPNCTDMSLCTQSETEQCLCRPRCDLVEPARLCYGDPPICGVPGACDVRGRCCRRICVGFSTADLFPTPDQPRDGAATDPMTMPWSPLNLEQQWTLETQTGQISVTSLRLPDTTSVSSLAGEAPTSRPSVEVAMPDNDKDLLDELFHPSGDVRPKQPWFEFRLAGLGVPEIERGLFVWVPSIRFVVIPGYLLDAVSLSLLRPAEAAVYADIAPGFCPAELPENDVGLFDNRLIQIRNLLKQVLEHHPADQADKPLPDGSMLVFRPDSGKSKTFVIDPQTNDIVVYSIDSGSYVLLWAALFVTVAIALLAGLAIMCTCALAYRKHLAEWRKSKLKEEFASVNAPEMMAVKFRSLHQRASRQRAAKKDHRKFSEDLEDDEEVEIEKEAELEMHARTNFFYNLKAFLGDAEQQQSVFSRFAEVLQAIVVAFFPIVIILVLADNWKSASLRTQCKFRPDKAACLQQLEPLHFTASVIVGIYVGLVVQEMVSHFLMVSLTRLRRALRYAFYAALLVVSWLAVALALLVCLWILLGVLLQPSRNAPYGAGLAGLLGNAFSLWVKKRRFQFKVSQAVSREMDEKRKKLAKTLPPDILIAVLDKNKERFLQDAGLSVPKIIVSIVQQLFFLLIIFIFCYLGFSAFTDLGDLTAGLINTGVIAIISVSFNNLNHEDSDSEAAKERVHEMQQKIVERIEKLFSRIHDQIHLAQHMFTKMKLDMDEELLSEDG